MPEIDPLDELVTKAKVVEGQHRLLLAELLRPHVRLDPDTGRIYFTEHPSKLNTKQYVLVYLLAKLALSQKNPEYTAVATTREVEESTGLPGGTVRPKLSQLLKERVISKTQAGYFIDAGHLASAKAILEQKSSD